MTQTVDTVYWGGSDELRLSVKFTTRVTHRDFYDFLEHARKFNAVRQPPRPESERTAQSDIIRCGSCDWQVLDGEGIIKTRSCCVEGLQVDLKHGLTPVAKKF